MFRRRITNDVELKQLANRTQVRTNLRRLTKVHAEDYEENAIELMCNPPKESNRKRAVRAESQHSQELRSPRAQGILRALKCFAPILRAEFPDSFRLLSSCIAFVDNQIYQSRPRFVSHTAYLSASTLSCRDHESVIIIGPVSWSHDIGLFS